VLLMLHFAQEINIFEFSVAVSDIRRQWYVSQQLPCDFFP
jgi:hypothetical protein